MSSNIFYMINDAGLHQYLFAFFVRLLIPQPKPQQRERLDFFSKIESHFVTWRPDGFFGFFWHGMAVGVAWLRLMEEEKIQNYWNSLSESSKVSFSL